MCGYRCCERGRALEPGRGQVRVFAERLTSHSTAAAPSRPLRVRPPPHAVEVTILSQQVCYF